MKYKIKKGKHYHSNWTARIKALFDIRNRSRIAYKAMLEENCWYPESFVNTAGYNKLFGGGALLHKQNSARFVWQPDYDNEGQFKIYSYVYTNGEWDAKYLFNMHVGQWYDMRIVKQPTGYLFDWTDGYDLITHPKPGLKKLLQPYFGGHDTAYNNMTIWLK